MTSDSSSTVGAVDRRKMSGTTGPTRRIAAWLQSIPTPAERPVGPLIGWRPAAVLVLGLLAATGMLLLGQIHGGVAQGLGQAVNENIVYDDSAQLLTGSFMDYGIPRADDMPGHIGFDTLPTISPTNPLGAKGCGEAGTIGAMPSVMNAIIDALDGTQVEMPASPEKLWRICQSLNHAEAAE